MIVAKLNGYIKIGEILMTAKFNPVKEDEAGKKARRMIWSSEAIELALKGLDMGKKLIANPFYENNTKLLKSDLVFQRTDKEVEEWNKCADDVIYFARQCSLMTPEGIQRIELRPYQEKYLQHLKDHRLSIYISCRQSGKTTTSAIFLLWFVLFNFDKNALVLGNKGKTAKEILDKIKKIFYELPFYLRPGVQKWNEMEIVFDNGCRIMAETTTPRSGISFTYHCVLADEFAHISSNIIDEFYENIFPTVTAAKARFIISSTQNGYNLFQRLYSGAVAGDNEYAPFKTDWPEVPEWDPEKKCWVKRDEAWHQLQIANYGSEEAFNKQFGTAFDSNANSLITNKFLKECSAHAVEFKQKDLPGADEHFVWHPDFEPAEDLKKGRFVITIDLAEGKGNDYTVFTITRLSKFNQHEIQYTTIGMYRCNTYDLQKTASVLCNFCKLYMIMNTYYVSIEINTYGELFIKYVMDEINNNPNDIYKFNEDCLLWYKKHNVLNINNKATFRIGVKLDAKEKLFGCTKFKTMFESGRILNQCSQFINELYNFCDNRGNNTYQASYGHDDMVMSQLQITFFENSTVYQNIKEELLNDVPVHNFMAEFAQSNVGGWFLDEPTETDKIMSRLQKY